MLNQGSAPPAQQHPRADPETTQRRPIAMNTSTSSHT